MKCSQCQHENKSGSKFCSYCGTKLQIICFQCGSKVGSTDLFCSECGADLAAKTETKSTFPTSISEPISYTPYYLEKKILRDRASLEGEQRIVTVLFCDLKSSMSLAERLGPEGTHTLINCFFNLALKEVSRYEGMINQFLGDGFMALFGAPVACEDHARRAVLAALGIQRALQKKEFDIIAEKNQKLIARMGLNTGLVVVGSIGDNLRMDYTAMGGTTNLAARMEQLAEPNSIYLSENTYREVQNYIECESLGMKKVKGKSGPVPVYRALREKPVRTRLQVATQHGLTPYVGRQKELVILKGYLEQAKHGQGQVVFVSGEAGIGKSRLLLEFRRSIEDEGIIWLEGHCISFGKSISYLPFIDIVKRAFAIEETDSEERIIELIDKGTSSWDTSALESVPYLKFLLNVDPGGPDFTTMDPLLRRSGIFDALRALLIKNEEQLVMVIEDLHWVDEQSESAISALIDVVASVPLLMILSYRPGYKHTLGERSYFSRLSLNHLLPKEGAEIVSGVLHSSVLPQDLQQLITNKAEGNPFYIEEVTKSLLETGVIRKEKGTYVLVLPIDQIRVPNTIQEVILSRIDRLQRKAKETIQIASVIGREFTFRLLEHISDIEGKLINLMEELKTLELIYQKDYFPEISYIFKHALTQDVAYSTLLLERRKELHRHIGAAIEEVYSDRLSEQYEVLAYHYTEGEDWVNALDYLIKSAQKATDAYAKSDAFAYFKRALDISEQIKDVPPETFMDIYTGLGKANLAMSKFTEAAAYFGHLHKIACQVGDKTIAGQALNNVAYSQMWSHMFDEAEATAQEALAIATEHHNDAVKAGALFVLGDLHANLGQLHLAEEKQTEAIRLSQKTNQHIYEVLGSTNLILNYGWRGYFEQAQQMAIHSINIASRHRLGHPQLYVRFSQSLALAGNGRYNDAIVSLWELINLCQQMDNKEVLSRAWNTLGWVFGELHDWIHAIEYNQKGLEIALTLGDDEILINAQINIADCAFESGEPEKACRQLEELYASLPQRHEWMKWRYSQHLTHSLGNALLACGHPERALKLADECLAIAEPSESRKNIIKGLRLSGQVFLALGDLKKAEQKLTSALSIAREIGNPPQLWKTFVITGDMRKAQNRPDEAHQAYHHALSTILKVADGLNDKSLKSTFINSSYVKGIPKKTKDDS